MQLMTARMLYSSHVCQLRRFNAMQQQVKTVVAVFARCYLINRSQDQIWVETRGTSRGSPTR